MNVPRPTDAEQAAFAAAINDMWQAAAVGYAEHLQLLLQRHRVPPDFQHPQRSATLLMVAAGVRTLSTRYDRDLAAVVAMLLGRGADANLTDSATGATPLHVLVAQPETCAVAARLKTLLQHAAAAPRGQVNPLDAPNRAGELPEDVAVGWDRQEHLRRLRVMIGLRSRR